MIRKSPVARLLETRRESAISDFLKLFRDGYRIVSGPLTHASGCLWWTLASPNGKKYIPIPEGWR
jgi:hypothetical protein